MGNLSPFLDDKITAQSVCRRRIKMAKFKARVDEHGRECNACHEYKLWGEFYSAGAGKRTSKCRECLLLRIQETKQGLVPKRKKNHIDDDGRECSKCHEYKSWDEYSKGNGRNGKSTTCRTCSSSAALAYFYEHHEESIAKKAIYREANRDSENARSSRYKKEHPEKNRANSRNDYWRNRDARLAASKQWREDNPEKDAECFRRKKRKNPDLYKEIQRAANKRFRENHPEDVAAREQKRRASKLQAMPFWADRAEILSVFLLARALRDATGLKYHVDHVIPLQHPLVCGLHVQANLRVVSAADNLSKHNKFDPETFDADDIPNVAWAHLDDEHEACRRAQELVEHILMAEGLTTK